jgi:hypothetical protein
MTQRDTQFWNITLDKEMIERFDEYRQSFKAKSGNTMSKAEFGRYMFEYWETEYLKNLQKLEDYKNEMDRLNNEMQRIKDNIHNPNLSILKSA